MTVACAARGSGGDGVGAASMRMPRVGPTGKGGGGARRGFGIVGTVVGGPVGRRPVIAVRFEKSQLLIKIILK